MGKPHLNRKECSFLKLHQSRFPHVASYFAIYIKSMWIGQLHTSILYLPLLSVPWCIHQHFNSAVTSVFFTESVILLQLHGEFAHLQPTIRIIYFYWNKENVVLNLQSPFDWTCSPIEHTFSTHIFMTLYYPSATMECSSNLYSALKCVNYTMKNHPNTQSKCYICL